MIGLFDSGSGGLSVYREIVKLLPWENYAYYSDNAHCPYGEKSREYIIDRARFITDFLIGEGCNIIVVACNTATAAAISTLRQEYSIPFIGMEPAVKPAAFLTRNGVVGVLATAGTISSTKYLDNKDLYTDKVTIVEHVGQGFVEMVEKGMLEGPEVEAVVERSVKPLIGAGADVIVLGCTHYPFLRPVIQKIAGPDVTVIDPAPAVARHLVTVMEEHDLLKKEARSESGALRLFSSGPSDSMERIVALL